MANPLDDEQQHTEELVMEWNIQADKTMAEFIRLGEEINSINNQTKNWRAKKISFEEAAKMGIIGPDVEQKVSTLAAKQMELLQILVSLLQKAERESELSIKLSKFLDSLDR